MPGTSIGSSSTTSPDIVPRPGSSPAPPRTGGPTQRRGGHHGPADYAPQTLEHLAAWDPASDGIPAGQTAGIEMTLFGESTSGFDDLTTLLLPRFPASPQSAGRPGRETHPAGPSSATASLTTPPSGATAACGSSHPPRFPGHPQPGKGQMLADCADLARRSRLGSCVQIVRRFRERRPGRVSWRRSPGSGGEGVGCTGRQ
jgi:hypothetical protein